MKAWILIPVQILLIIIAALINIIWIFFPKLNSNLFYILISINLFAILLVFILYIYLIFRRNVVKIDPVLSAGQGKVQNRGLEVINSMSYYRGRIDFENDQLLSIKPFLLPIYLDEAEIEKWAEYYASYYIQKDELKINNIVLKKIDKLYQMIDILDTDPCYDQKTDSYDSKENYLEGIFSVILADYSEKRNFLRENKKKKLYEIYKKSIEEQSRSSEKQF